MLHFDKVYCIHLPESRDRLPLITQELKTVNLYGKTEFIAANVPHCTINNMRRNPKRELGANLSHIKAILKAIEDQSNYPLFIEDDITFHSNAKQKIEAAFTELPPNWKCLHMNGHPRGRLNPATRYSDNLAHVGKFSFADSYCIPKPFLFEFVNFWLDNIGRPKDAMFDFLLSDWSDSYCVYPPVVSQRDGWSYIGQKQDTKKNLLQKGWHGLQ